MLESLLRLHQLTDSDHNFTTTPKIIARQSAKNSVTILGRTFIFELNPLPNRSLNTR